MTVLSRVRLTPAALTRRTAWTDGRLWFAKEPFADVLAEFNRYHRQPVVLVDPALVHLDIGGRFRSADLDSFIATAGTFLQCPKDSSAIHDSDMDVVYVTGRCPRERYQCNWPLVQ